MTKHRSVPTTYGDFYNIDSILENYFNDKKQTLDKKAIEKFKSLNVYCSNLNEIFNDKKELKQIYSLINLLLYHAPNKSIYLVELNKKQKVKESHKRSKQPITIQKYRNIE